MRGASWCGRPCGVAAGASDSLAAARGGRGFGRDQLGDGVRIVTLCRLGLGLVVLQRLGDRIDLRLGCRLLRPFRRLGHGLGNIGLLFGWLGRRGRFRLRRRHGFGLGRRRRLLSCAQLGRGLGRRGRRRLGLGLRLRFGPRRGRRHGSGLGVLLAVHDLVELGLRDGLDRNRFLAVVEFARRCEPQDQEQHQGAMERARDRPGPI